MDEQSTIDIKNITSQGMIYKTSDKGISKLNHHSQEFFNSLSDVHEQKAKMMMTVHDGQEFGKAAVTSLRTYTHNLVNHGRDYDIVQQAGDIQSRLVSISIYEIPYFTWNCYETTQAKKKHDPLVFPESP